MSVWGLILVLAACQGTQDTGIETDCSGSAGAHQATLVLEDGISRDYALVVPEAYDCEQAWPLLVDLHGTQYSPADEPIQPELLGAYEDLAELAREEGFILARPRSSSAEGSGWLGYTWDVNSGDLGLNAEILVELVRTLRRQYHLDEDQIHLTGMATGTNMALQLLDEPALGLDGLGIVGGGYWVDPGIESLATSRTRIFLGTGYRDPAYVHQRWLEALLDHLEHPGELRRVRELDGAHSRPEWLLAEQWVYLSQGGDPAPSTLRQGWSREQDFPGGDSLLELVSTPDGGLLVTDAQGGIWRRTQGDWAQVHTPTTALPPAWTGLCAGPDGVAVAVGEASLAVSQDQGRTWSLPPPIPDFEAVWASDDARPLSVACGPDQVVAVGSMGAAISADGGWTWSQASVDYPWGNPAEVATVGRSDAGTWVAAGAHYLARSTDGENFSPSADWFEILEWHLDLEPGPEGRWWVAGADRGHVLCSSDDGYTWDYCSPPGAGDLYAIDFHDLRGLAVGAHGEAWLTLDGGVFWQEVSTGVDLYLGDVHFLDQSTALVVGERGAMLRYEVEE